MATDVIGDFHLTTPDCLMVNMPTDNFRDHLRRQFGFLERSCAAFDSGSHDEAIRIATVVRVLVHDTPRSTSLLTHLKATDARLLSTCLDIVRKFQDPWYGAAMPDMFNGMGLFSPGEHPYRPKLGNTPIRNYIPVVEWWNQVVFILDRSTCVTRRSVVLAAANKDGGAHVDTSLTPEYERLIHGGDLGAWAIQGADGEHLVPITGHHLVALRQIGFEVLNSPDLLALSAS